MINASLRGRYCTPQSIVSSNGDRLGIFGRWLRDRSDQFAGLNCGKTIHSYLKITLSVLLFVAVSFLIYFKVLAVEYWFSEGLCITE